MQQITLDHAERELLALIGARTGERGGIERGALSVTARGQGLEVGRLLARLKMHGLVEETERRPFFLGRLFGAKPVSLLRLSAAGQALLTPPAPELPASEPIAPDAAAPIAPADPEPVGAEPAEDLAPATDETAPPIASIEPVSDVSAAQIELPVEPEPAPVTRTAPARPVPQAPRIPVSVFTEDLGGTPEADTPLLAAEIAPELLEGLRELLEGCGMELTMAGEALVADRMSRGASVGEALSQVVLYAFAHAVRYDEISEGEVQAFGLNDYAIEVMREVEKLRDAGVIGEQPFEADMRQLWDMLQGGDERLARAEALLQDPVGGAAPPAFLPEDLRRAEEG